MRRRTALRNCAGWLIGLPSLAACAQTPKQKRQDGKMNVSAPNTIELPFGLKPEQLAGVEIVYKYQSYKTGAGRQELRLRGDGQVLLARSRAYNLPEETLEGKLQRMNFIRLLEVAEETNFFGMDESYKGPGGDPYWKRIISVKLVDGREHAVGVTNDHLHAPFERFAGAIRVIASLAVPEVLKARFFVNL